MSRADPYLPEEVLAAFLDGPADISELGSGHINHTYLVTGDSDQFVIQEINTRVFTRPAEVMENIQLASDCLEKNSYPLDILKPIPALDGRILVENNGSSFRAYPFFTETVVYERAKNIDMAARAGQAFGEYTACINKLDPDRLHFTIPGFHDLRNRMEQFKASLENGDSERISSSRKFVLEVLDHNSLLEETCDLLEKCPVRAIHGDPKISNILFNNTGEARCIIDLDTLMPGPLLYDLSDMIRSFSNTAKEDEEDLSKVDISMPILGSLLTAYLDELDALLTKEEIHAMAKGYPIITYVQVLRFLSDYFSGDVYYKVSYPDHNLIRAKNQMKVFMRLLSEEEHLHSLFQRYLPV